MKLTQKDLACKLNMQIKDIQDIESGKALENKMVLSKIRKMLNLSTRT
jgi:ribosome-binding protein aMBF1 (putative translation factor)